MIGILASYACTSIVEQINKYSFFMYFLHANLAEPSTKKAGSFFEEATCLVIIIQAYNLIELKEDKSLLQGITKWIIIIRLVKLPLRYSFYYFWLFSSVVHVASCKSENSEEAGKKRKRLILTKFVLVIFF